MPYCTGQADRNFSSNPDTIAIGVRAIRIISIGFIVSSIPVTISGALEALGKGISSLIISILRYIGIMLLLACILNKVIGAQGVWHSFWITEFITAFAAVIIYKKLLKNHNLRFLISEIYLSISVEAAAPSPTAVTT